MRGLMQDFPLTIQHIFWRAERLFPEKQIVTVTPEGIHRYTYQEFGVRVRRLAGALVAAGVRRGDRVASFAANTFRHHELYFAVPCIGAVLHTLNPRFSPQQLASAVRQVQDRLLFFDGPLFRLLEPVLPQLKGVQGLVSMGVGDPAGAIAYEDFMGTGEPVEAWPQLAETEAAGICHTSGTTGDPRGVVYSHRSTVLHAFGVNSGSAFGLREDDTTMAIVPMYHAMAWGFPYAATMAGCNQVYPGPFPSPQTLLHLIESERVTVSAAVPTVWIGVLEELERRRADLSSIRLLAAGGAAVPISVVEAFESRCGITILPSWGMTETSPVCTLGHLKSELKQSPPERRYAALTTSGFPLPGVELRIVDDEGSELPWDGSAFGELQVRGPWVASGYQGQQESASSFTEGWLRTGDVATIDRWGYLRIVDRTKDLVKSGGEWIPSVELERALMSHPGVREAAVIAVPHPRWGERPAACVALRRGASVSKEDLLRHLGRSFPSWWLPDQLFFLDEVPKTSVGKFDKKRLRERFAGDPPGQA